MELHLASLLYASGNRDETNHSVGELVDGFIQGFGFPTAVYSFDYDDVFCVGAADLAIEGAIIRATIGDGQRGERDDAGNGYGSSWAVENKCNCTGNRNQSLLQTAVTKRWRENDGRPVTQTPPTSFFPLSNVPAEV